MRRRNTMVRFFEILNTEFLSQLLYLQKLANNSITPPNVTTMTMRSTVASYCTIAFTIDTIIIIIGTIDLIIAPPL